MRREFSLDGAPLTLDNHAKDRFGLRPSDPTGDGPEMETLLRRLRGALLNGVLWSGAWSVASVGVSAMLRVFGLGGGSFVDVLPSVVIGGAFIGFASGMGFSLVLAAAFRNRELNGIRYAPFTLAGAVVAGVLVPSLFYLPLVMSGGVVTGMELGLNAAMASLLGASTSFAMLRLAKAAPPSLERGAGPTPAQTPIGAGEP